MDSVLRLRRTARFVLGMILLALAGCGPAAEKPVGKGDQEGGSGPTAPLEPAPPSVPPPVVGVPDASVPLVAMLWEKKNPVEGPKWSQFAFDLIRTEEKNLMAGTKDVTSFCPNYARLSEEQKASFWVYLVSAMTKYESNFDPLNRYKESTMGKDSVTGEAVWSEGLLQLSYQDGRNYSFCNEFDWPRDKLLSRTDPRKTILDPYKNLRCGIRIMNQIMGRKNLIAFGSGHYWAVLKSSSGHHRIKEIKALTNQIAFCR